MNKTLKWILWIALGLVVLFGVGYLAASFFGYGHIGVWGRPMMGGYEDWNRSPMGGYQNFRHPMMGGSWFGVFGLPFMFFGGLLRLIFPLGLLAMVIYFSYRAGKQAGYREAQAPPAPAPAPESEKAE